MSKYFISSTSFRDRSLQLYYQLLLHIKSLASQPWTCGDSATLNRSRRRQMTEEEITQLIDFGIGTIAARMDCIFSLVT
jgi:hypothetical protein